MKVEKKMRRSRQLLKHEECMAVMGRCSNGVLACIDEDGLPYAVPLSYVYHCDKIYFHSAKAGHKMDAIAKHSQVSFAMVDADQIVSNEYTSYFRSVIAFGKARLVEGEERLKAFAALVDKYSGDQPSAAKEKEIHGCTQAAIVAIDLERLTGKEAVELVNARKNR